MLFVIHQKKRKEKTTNKEEQSSGLFSNFLLPTRYRFDGPSLSKPKSCEDGFPPPLSNKNSHEKFFTEMDCPKYKKKGEEMTEEQMCRHWCCRHENEMPI